MTSGLSGIDYLEKRQMLTAPTATYPFEGEFKGVHQLAGGEKRVYVNQNYALRSTSEEVLGSEGFSSCSALIIQNKDTPEAYLAHITKWDLTDQQYEELARLSPGKYLVTFVVGSFSRVSSDTLANPDVSQFMNKLKADNREAEVAGDVVVPSGDGHWSVSYSPKDKKIKVFTRKDKMVREYPLMV